MASLAPGNGWYPRRTPPSRRGVIAERRPAVAGNVYAFPGTSNPFTLANQWQAASGSAVATRLAALLVADSIKAGRTVSWVLGWCVFGLVAGSLVWLGLTSVLVSTALLYGVPWITVAAAATLIHMLGAALVVMMGLRIGRRTLLSVEKRNRFLRSAA
jgi:positive regulator of sigma E activity